MAPGTDEARVLVLDCGSQVSHLICRRCREFGVYSELQTILTPFVELQAFNPTAVIISGGPHSVYEDGAPHLGEEVWSWLREKAMPVLGICYGLQEMIHANGGKVGPGVAREFGHANMDVVDDSALLKGIPTRSRVWMSHGDKVLSMPPEFIVIANTENSEFAAVKHATLPFCGVQFHPEVTHTEYGTKMLENFCANVANCRLLSWTMKNYLTAEIERICKLVGDRDVLGAVSGGVDSSVGAALMHKAIGEKFRPFLVDTGFMRKDEAAEVLDRLTKHIPGLKLRVLDDSKAFFEGLAGKTEPEDKRKTIGRLFIESFEKGVKLEKLNPEECYFLQGTLYPDVIESTSFRGPSTTIKSHHNVGGLPEHLKFKGLIEPLRLLFKDEVRALGRELGLPEESVMRHPFPGPGLAIRIIGAPLTRELADVLRDADAIFIEELKNANLYNQIGQAFTILLPAVKTVGVMGDHRTYEMTCCLRAVSTSDFMTADWFQMPRDILARVSGRIINEVRGINRVCYDISSKPPSTIEWE